VTSIRYAETGSCLGGPRLKRHSVLVVDDEPSVRSLFEEALTESGHSVAVAENGAEALDQLRDGSLPCVVLTDVRMPRMDGFELSRAVADDPQLASIPIVVLTGDRILSFTSPARDKPFSVAELDALVQRSCSLHRASRDIIG
jgi:twitching motility two-component system response regulator PilH